MVKVQLLSEAEGIDATIECGPEDSILDGADKGGVDLPYSCRAGACSSCAGRIKEGEVNQSEQSFLDDDQMADGFILTCVAFPIGDCVVLVHEEEELY